MPSTPNKPHRLAEIQVAELDLDGPDGAVLRFGPAPGGGPPVRAGDVYALVRLRGRPVATVVCAVPPGRDPADAVAAAARAKLAHDALPAYGGAHDALPPYGGAHDLLPPYGGAHDVLPAYGGAHDALPAYGGAHDVLPAYGGAHDVLPPYGGAHDVLPPYGGAHEETTHRAATTNAPGPPRPQDPAHATGPPWPQDPAHAPGPRSPHDRVQDRATIVVATRERADQLARALDSLLAQDHPDFEIVVVDNAPVTSATHDLVEHKYGERVRYVREPVPGLAVAHNRGIAAADGAVIAFTDDDVVADPHWLTALTAPFARDPGLGCATGLILPARLRTPAQILLESHGGFAKGFAPRQYDPAHPPAGEPLFPFTAGSFGSGANMAFRATVLREIGGFDPATGTGTPARGGDDLYAFVSVLAAGHRLRYTPDALVWHHHRESWQDLKNQAYGYGAGLTAYLTAVLVRRPALLPALLRKLPRGLAHARSITAHREAGGASVPGEHGAQDYPWPRHLSRLERRGMLAGPIGYAKARRRVRGVPLPWGSRPQRDEE
ncbi:glycosyltransferase [Streptomyces sp. NBC_01210]|uniref:glycosyltransferase n=1 Tax=Streptomyces sp. NBC_01210 TaxID=2903774 RepID=UPI002E11F618|nr:glycosyltransferase [Streptomyces sp. NBC_01210]